MPYAGAEAEKVLEELEALRNQNRSLQALVGELLLTNQRLREELAKHRQYCPATAPATHPPRHPDR